MEPIKTAVENAMQFARDTLGAGRTADMRLEEVESETVAGKDAWLITLSMINIDGPLGANKRGCQLIRSGCQTRIQGIHGGEGQWRCDRDEDSGIRDDVTLDSRGLLDKHKGRGVFVDTNLLVLFLVGSVNRRRILNFKRTQNFDVGDFDLLLRLINWLGPRLVSTPHVMSQVSDLTDLPGKELHEVRRLFCAAVETIEEIYDPSRGIVEDALFARLGLADAAIASACSKGILVLTSDLKLHLALEERELDTLNFNHVRALEWASDAPRLT